MNPSNRTEPAAQRRFELARCSTENAAVENEHVRGSRCQPDHYVAVIEAQSLALELESNLGPKSGVSVGIPEVGDFCAYRNAVSGDNSAMTTLVQNILYES